MDWDADNLHWEEIDRVESHDNGPYVVTERTSVPGGYLVRIIGYTWDGLPSLGVSITFVPDLPAKQEGAA